MRLRLTRRATSDLGDIADYVRERNPPAATRVRAVIIESLRDLLLFPRIGRRQTVEGVRKIVTRRYRYLIYYRIEEATEEVVVLTIQHPARQRENADV